MNDFDQTWKDADPDAAGGGDDLTPPPDGTYDVALTGASAFIARTTGNAMVKMEWRVIGSDHQDYEWTVLLGFKSQKQANMTKREARNLGVDVDNVDGIDALDDALRGCVGRYYTVETKTNGDFKNTYISDLGPISSDIPITDMPQPETVPAGGGDDSDDDGVPF